MTHSVSTAQHTEGETVLTPSTVGVTLAQCPVGLFHSEGGSLCLKTEYGNNEGRIDAYIVDSGEFFWGPAPQTIAHQRAQIVFPVLVSPFALRPKEAGEAVAWQHRYKEFGSDEYVSWRDGRLSGAPSSSHSREERPLYASPPSPVSREAVIVPRDKLALAADLLNLYQRNPAWKALADEFTGLLALSPEVGNDK